VTVTFDQARDAARALGGALATQRIYGRAHDRAHHARERIETVIRVLPAAITLGRGERGIVWDGLPLGTERALSTLADCLEHAGAWGLRLEPDAVFDRLPALLDWLEDAPPGAAVPVCDAVAVVSEEAGEDEEDPFPRFTARFPELRRPLQLYRDAARGFERAILDGQAHDEIDLDPVTRTASRVARLMRHGGARLLAPLRLLHEDAFTWQHTTNVFLLATAALLPVASDEKELARFALAALLHDIGKCRIEPALLAKRASLTTAESAALQRHPELGAELLLGHGADPLCVEVAYCHHMRAGGFGYPSPALGLAPGPVTEVVQVADLFTGLTGVQPNREPLSPCEAIETIRRMPGMGGAEAAIQLVEAALGDCPAGSEVLLSNGERGLVVQDNPEAPARPLVRVLADAKGRELSETLLRDLREDEASVVALRTNSSILAQCVA